MIDTALQSKLQTSIPYTWSMEGIPYLGIRLVSNVAQLADVNYIPLINKLTKAAHCMAKCDLSWTGCLASFKMIILPQIYIFITLAILVKKTHMQALNTILRKSVWKEDMRPSSPHALLLKHKYAGGMGMTDLHDYWVATHLSHIQSWFSPSTDKLWIDIEKTTSPVPSLNHLLIADIWKPWPIKHLPLPTQASLIVWRAFSSKLTDSANTYPAKGTGNDYPPTFPHQVRKTGNLNPVTYAQSPNPLNSSKFHISPTDQYL